ncbi:hypothetical protein [Rhizobium indicum]|uniref:hypothetical protein n=1 Tax=Rhizobium indicum TaxID=2583231 RepID=UPI001FF050F9|nr:hypothetical protein [Rhizobium indicum]
MPDRILLLEDEPFIALDLEGVLKEHGYDVVTRTTCAEALAWLEDNAPSMAIVDPHLSGGLCSAVVRHLAKGQVPFGVYSGEPGS